MGTHNQPEPDTRPVLHGLCPFLLAASGVVLPVLLWPDNRWGKEAENLTIQGGWAVYMTLTLGLASASWRRGPEGGRWLAAAAVAVCMVSIGWVAVTYAKVLWR